MTPAARATRIVRSVPAIARSGVEDVGQETAHPGGAGRELEASVAELDDRDRTEERALPGRVRFDVAFDEVGRHEAGLATRVEQGDNVASGFVTQAAAGAAVQDQVGEG